MILGATLLILAGFLAGLRCGWSLGLDYGRAETRARFLLRAIREREER